MRRLLERFVSSDALISADLRGEIEKHYHESNTRLRAMIEDDLSSYP